MGFQRVVGSGDKSQAPKVGVWKAGMIGFNKAATEKYDLEKFEFAVLYCDPDRKQVGIQFTNDAKEQGARKIGKRKYGQFAVAGKALWKSFPDVKPDHTKQYDLEYDSENEMYVIQL